tara:strand:- start:106 stop:711 length:606 start_codon:yes stop_codon:yes gene_type:complete
MMKTVQRMLTVLLASVSVNCLQAEEGGFEQLLLPYFETQAALASDDFQGARIGATQLAMNARLREVKENPAPWAEGIRNTAREIAFSPNIEAARSLFATLSKDFIAVAKTQVSESPYNIVEMHCSMALDHAGASWLQSSAELANPYYGASMLRCGSTVSTIVEGKAYELSVKAVEGDACCSAESPAKKEAEKDACCTSPNK